MRTWAVLMACGLLAVGCGEGGGVIAGAVVAATLDAPNAQGPGVPPGSVDFDGAPSAIHVQGATLRNIPGGCEVDVTFKNVSTKLVSAGFRYDILDARGQHVVSRDTAVRQARPGEVTTVSSEGTTAGASGIPCPAGGRPRLVEVSVWNL
jgi:hypothetical protein